VGDFVVDPYCGSGSSAEAAFRLGRNFLGYEIDKVYYDRILKRINNLGVKDD